eukprot:scaffold38748_cov21-Tisochrysis_lutea.AAC.1
MVRMVCRRDVASRGTAQARAWYPGQTLQSRTNFAIQGKAQVYEVFRASVAIQGIAQAVVAARHCLLLLLLLQSAQRFAFMHEEWGSICVIQDERRQSCVDMYAKLLTALACRMHMRRQGTENTCPHLSQSLSLFQHTHTHMHHN